MHNETVNIYSHFIPAIVFLLGEFYMLQYLAGRYSRVTIHDLLAFSIFVLTGTICFASSALYHTIMNHSYTVDHFCRRLDMLGIGVFIVGDIVLGVYIVFWCETTLRNIYWSVVSLCLHARFVQSDRCWKLMSSLTFDRSQSLGPWPRSRISCQKFKARNIAACER